MRVYFVRLTDADCTRNGDVFTSSVIDLYDNNTYKNYSTTRSGYGLNSLGNGTWTGRELVSPGVTDTGTFSGGRYIDTSGRIDVVSWTINTTMLSGTGPVLWKLTPYVVADEGATYPDEYLTSLPIASNEEIGIIDCPRWAVFQFAATAPTGSDFSFEVLIRTEVDPPIMAPKYRATQQLLNEYPEWMALREYEDRFPATPELATPTSLGGAVINALAGQWVEELSSDLSYTRFQLQIQTADLNQATWVYKVLDAPQYLWSFSTTAAGELARAIDLEEFYDAVAAGQNILWWDEEADVIYVSKNYGYLYSINGVAAAADSPVQPHHVWNAFDDFGLLVDLARLHLESNEDYRSRILDVGRNALSVGVTGLQMALRRELNMWSLYGSTPDSAFLGATPEVLEVSDLEADAFYVDPNGMPTAKFRRLVQRLAVDYPTTWGHFRWDRAYWDIGGDENAGFSVLPYQFDATPSSAADIQPGVGDLDDLYLVRPDAITGPRDFTGQLVLRGRQQTTRNEYPTVDLDVDIYGQWDRKVYTNPPKTVWMTVEITTTDSGNPTYFHAFQLTATSDVDVDTPTPTLASAGIFNFFDDDGTGTDDALTFSNKTNGADYPGGGKIPLANIQTIKLRSGKYTIAATPYYALAEGTDTFSAWFSHDAVQVLTYNTAVGSVPSYSFSAVSPQSSVVMTSKVTSYVVQRFSSERFPYHIQINTAVPNTSAAQVVINTPPIIWDPYQEATPNRNVTVEIKTVDASGVFGATTLNEAGVEVFLPASTYISLNASTTWTAGVRGLAGNTATLTFATAAGPLYPIAATVWALFEQAQLTPFTGTVDENGPWRNGEPSTPGNTNFTLMSVNVDRADFGIPDSTTYVVTSMGVEVLDDPRVILWLDSNTVKPATTDASDVTYPANAIQEVFTSGTYSYDPFIIRARIRPGASPGWEPSVHSGWYYQAGREGYVYADPLTASVSTTTYVLPDLVRQGAPVIVWTNGATPREMRQVAFFDATQATPGLSLTTTEVVPGTGTTKLYVAHPDIYNVSAVDLTTGQSVTVTATAAANAVTTSVVTLRDHEYQVSYTLRGSFLLDNEYTDANGVYKSRLVFDGLPSSVGATAYLVTYETARFDPATPVDLPLNALYTSVPEGFVFLSHNEYTLDRVEVAVSPSKLVADGEDYLLVVLHSYDRYGNPKGNQNFTLSSTFGTFDDTTITTDRDGFAKAVLTAGTGSVTTGTITVAGAVSASLSFGVEPPDINDYRLLAVPREEQIPANGTSTNIVYGRVEDANYAGVAGLTVHWRRARSIYELFTGSPPAPAAPPNLSVYAYSGVTAPATTVTTRPAEAFAGTVVTAADGSFIVGPFTSTLPDQNGLWFVSLEIQGAHATGDVVFWNEYPDSLYGVNPLTRMPRQSVQDATPPSWYPPYATANTFPSYYDEATPYAAATPVYGTGLENWLPPLWYAIPKYQQYQLGLLGNTRGQVTYDPAKVRKFRKVI